MIILNTHYAHVHQDNDGGVRVHPRRMPMTPEEAMELGTALINAAFPFQKTGRDSASSRMVEVDTPANTSHRVSEAGACDCPQCIGMAVDRG